jgi:hypothetical protein
VMVGPYVRSSILIGKSEAKSGGTVCLNCSIRIMGTSISNSEASSITSGNFDTSCISARSFCCVRLESRHFSCLQALPKMNSDIVSLFFRRLLRSVCTSAVRHEISVFAAHGCTAGLRWRCLCCGPALPLERELLSWQFQSFSGNNERFRTFSHFQRLQLQQHFGSNTIL